MSRSINRVQLLGHLGQDAETKYTPSGVACTSFSIATNRRWKDQQTGEYKEATDWHRCVLWRSEKVAAYLTKGKQIHVAGRLQTRQWDDNGSTRYMTEVIVDDLVLLGGSDQARPAAAGAGRARQQTTSQAPPDDLSQGITDDDVPF